MPLAEERVGLTAGKPEEEGDAVQAIAEAAGQVASLRRVVAALVVVLAILCVSGFVRQASAAARARSGQRPMPSPLPFASVQVYSWDTSLFSPCVVPDVIERLVKNGTVEPPCDGLPWGALHLSEQERRAMFRVVKGANQYVEYGTEGRANVFALLPRNALTIEHVPLYCRNTMGEPLTRFNVHVRRQRFVCVDTGLELFSNGHPRCNHSAPASTCALKFEEYVNAIELVGDSRVDVVYVNGRFRVACALRALEFVDESSRVVVHQYGRYRRVLSRYFDVVEMAGEIGVLRAKPEFVGNAHLFRTFLTNSDES